MLDWYHPHDVLGWPDELVLDSTMSFEHCLAQIMTLIGAGFPA